MNSWTRRVATLISLMLVAVLVGVACSGAPEEAETPTEASASEPTEAPADEEPVEEEPVEEEPVEEEPAEEEPVEEEPAEEEPAEEEPSAEGEVGVTDDEILLGMYSSLTGPLASTGTPALEGLQTWVEDVNARGGIGGRQVRLIDYDDAGSPEEAVAAARRLIEQDQVFALVCGSGSSPTLATLDLVDESGIPFVSCISAHRDVLNPFRPNVYRVYANEIAQSEEVVRYITEDLGAERPAIIYNSTDFGVGGYEIMVEWLANEKGLEFVAAERYNVGDQDFTAPLLNISSAEPDVLIMHSFAAEAGVIVRQARELGIDVPLVGGGGVPTPLLPEAAGEDAVGVVAVWVFPVRPEDTSGPMATLRELQEQYIFPDGYPAGRPSLYDMTGYMTGTIVEEALQVCTDTLTRECFMDALDSMEGFEPGGGIGFPVTFTDSDHEGTDETAWVRVNSDLEWELFDPAAE